MSQTWHSPGAWRKDMIGRCLPEEIDSIYSVINDGAKAYRGFIPADCYHEPYMSFDELSREMEQMSFFGWRENKELVGVIGFQPVEDVTLVRHAYVMGSWRRRGIGSGLLNEVKACTRTRRLLVGTWVDAWWAIRFYEQHGFSLVTDKDKLLRAYWRIPARQVEVSVVLGLSLP